jgi:isopentenyl-diphosphate Delta-isomerase
MGVLPMPINGTSKKNRIMTAVILVDEQDNELGLMEKMEAHEKALLHRAFSVFIFNAVGEMLLQQRAKAKYHSGGLWTNACCSHPLPGEAVGYAAQRRLMEEMGFATQLNKVFDFVYKADFDNGLTEHEFDHVFTGQYDGAIAPDAAEVQDYCYKPMDAIRADIMSHPHHFTEWFKIAFPKLEEYLAARS